jgi:hypothetical protein
MSVELSVRSGLRTSDRRPHGLVCPDATADDTLASHPSGRQTCRVSTLEQPVVERPAGDECWCCGTPAQPGVRLGNHPEVVVCLRCARWLSKQAGAVEDGARSSPAAAARNALRAARGYVVRHGWHRHRAVGRPLRWLGRWLP